jgi:tRNA modification GTPase
VRISAATGENLDSLRTELLRAVQGAPVDRDVPAITNTRHAELLKRAESHLDRAAAAAGDGVPEEFVLADVHDARAALEEITGRRDADAIVHAIFDKFCIGK